MAALKVSSGKAEGLPSTESLRPWMFFSLSSFSGTLFISVGILASALTRNQAVAGILAFVLLLALVIGTRFAATLEVLKLEHLASVRAGVDYLQVFTHLEDFTRGVVDTRQVLYYLSGTALSLILGILGVEAKLLHS